MLLNDLATMATHARRSETFEAFLVGAFPQYRDFKSFDEENRWRLQFLKRG